MKRALFSCALIVAAAMPVAAATTSRYLVATRRPARLAQLRLVQDAATAEERDVRTFENFEVFSASLTEGEADELRSSIEVRHIEPVLERHALGLNLEETRYSTSQSVSYGIDQVRAREVWNLTRGGQIHVAVLDTGLDIEHPDLKARYAGGFNTFDADKLPQDDNRHGTHVAGIIGALDNGFGVVGVAPEVNLWAVKALDKTGFGTTDNILRGIDWVIEKKRAIGGNWIMNLSLGADKPSVVEREAFEKLRDEGILVIAAAGNGGFDSVDYPAAYPTVLGVGAVDDKKSLATFSSHGAGMAMVAPGVLIASTVPSGFARAVDVLVDELTLPASSVSGSPLGDVVGQFVFCGQGYPADYPPNMAGKIAVVRRAPDGVLHYFYEKALAAKQAGAAALVIINKPNFTNEFGWTLNPQLCDASGCSEPFKDYAWPLTIGISYSSGERLLQKLTSTIDVSYREESYDLLSGTSMSVPHVVGAAALLWALSPDATADQIRTALELSATDLGLPGRDSRYGAGLLDVIAAAKLLAPEKFGLPDPPAPPRRRAGHH